MLRIYECFMLHGDGLLEIISMNLAVTFFKLHLPTWRLVVIYKRDTNFWSAIIFPSPDANNELQCTGRHSLILAHE